MSRYARIRVGVEGSEQADYGRPRINEMFELELTPDEWMAYPIQVDTTQLTLTTSNFSSITAAIIYNEDTTNYVEVEWWDQRGTQAAGNLVFADADPDTITDGDTNSTFVTNGGEVGGYVRVASAEDSANDGAWLIRAITTDVITVVGTAALTANAADTSATLSFERKNKARVVAGYPLVINRPLASQNLLLQANTAACNCMVVLFGT